MTAYGLLLTGFAAKPETAIKSDLDAGCRTAYGPSVPLGPKSLLGQYNGLVSGALAEVWELAQAGDAAQDPDAAAGAALEQLCALTGTLREGASPSTVTLTLTGTAATSIAAGSRAGSATTTAQFATDVIAALSDLDPWVGATPYTVGDRVSNASRSYVCITAGTSDTTPGPTTTALDITDDSAHWRYLGEGTAAGDVAATCTVDGPTVATSGDLTTIRNGTLITDLKLYADTDADDPIIHMPVAKVFKSTPKGEINGRFMYDVTGKSKGPFTFNDPN